MSITPLINKTMLHCERISQYAVRDPLVSKVSGSISVAWLFFFDTSLYGWTSCIHQCNLNYTQDNMVCTPLSHRRCMCKAILHHTLILWILVSQVSTRALNNASFKNGIWANCNKRMVQVMKSASGELLVKVLKGFIWTTEIQAWLILFCIWFSNNFFLKLRSFEVALFEKYLTCYSYFWLDW